MIFFPNQLSYVFAYLSMGFNFVTGPLSMPIYVSIPVVESLMVYWVHRYFIITFSWVTWVHLIVYDMVDFDVILSIDWFALDNAIRDC